MTSKQQIELTIRAAQLGKAVMGLVGVKDMLRAKLHMKSILDEFEKVAKCLQSIEAEAEEGNTT